MERSDKHNEVELNFLDAGWLRYLMGGRLLDVRAGELAVFWAGVPHQIVAFDDACSYYVVTVPVREFTSWQLPDALTRPLMHGEPVVCDVQHRLSGDLDHLSLWEDDLNSGLAERRHVCMLEIQAWLRRLLLEGRLGRGVAEPVRVAGSDIVLAGRVAQFINDRATTKLAVSDIADHFGLHPNSVMRLFKRAFGMTLVDYLTESRVFHAQRLLVTTDRPIGDIAHLAGFGSLTRFNEAFKHEVGCSPRAFRQSQPGNR